jgi:hypothetical protein
MYGTMRHGFGALLAPTPTTISLLAFNFCALFGVFTYAQGFATARRMWRVVAPAYVVFCVVELAKLIMLSSGAAQFAHLSPAVRTASLAIGFGTAAALDMFTCIALLRLGGWLPDPQAPAETSDERLSTIFA